MNTTDRYVKSREALEMEVSAMRELPRDLVTILRTEANNQRTPPIDYVIAEDGGRMVHTPEPDIAMAELLEEAAAALAEKDKEIAALREALFVADEAIMRSHGCFPLDRTTPDEVFLNDAATLIRSYTYVDYAKRRLIVDQWVARNEGGKDAE